MLGGQPALPACPLGRSRRTFAIEDEKYPDFKYEMIFVNEGY